MWSMNKTLQVRDVVAALAVVLSVGFVCLEIQQNSKARVCSTTQAAVSDYIKSLERFVDNPPIESYPFRDTSDQPCS